MWKQTLLQARLNIIVAKRFFVDRKPVPKRAVFHLNQQWRRERGLSLNPNSEGILTDCPDYSFLDGRPTPYGVRQLNRILKQQQITEQIIKLSAEIDFAVDRHEKLQQEEKIWRQQLLDVKLKPKGIALLKKKH